MFVEAEYFGVLHDKMYTGMFTHAFKNVCSKGKCDFKNIANLLDIESLNYFALHSKCLVYLQCTVFLYVQIMGADN